MGVQVQPLVLSNMFAGQTDLSGPSTYSDILCLVPHHCNSRGRYLQLRGYLRAQCTPSLCLDLDGVGTHSGFVFRVGSADEDVVCPAILQYPLQHLFPAHRWSPSRAQVPLASSMSDSKRTDIRCSSVLCYCCRHLYD